MKVTAAMIASASGRLVKILSHESTNSAARAASKGGGGFLRHRGRRLIGQRLSQTVPPTWWPRVRPLRSPPSKGMPPWRRRSPPNALCDCARVQPDRVRLRGHGQAVFPRAADHLSRLSYTPRRVRHADVVVVYVLTRQHPGTAPRARLILRGRAARPRSRVLSGRRSAADATVSRRGGTVRHEQWPSGPGDPVDGRGRAVGR